MNDAAAGADDRDSPLFAAAQRRERLFFAGMALLLLATVAVAMVLTGLLAGADTLRRNVPPGFAQLLVLINVNMMFLFAVLIALAFRMRKDPPAHKRLVLIANVALMYASFIRWPVGFLFHNIHTATRAPYCFLALIAVYDLWSMGRIHRVTLWASVFVVLVFEAQFFIAETTVWRALAAWIQTLGA